jgi:cellulose synthase/poly-beta-1,6-N-acetylglucosamine synthase-like glycosyltransferase
MSKGRSAPGIPRPVMFLFTQTLLLIAQSLFLLPVAYLLWLTWAAQRALPHTVASSKKWTARFLILIPAHNEQRLLPECLKSILQSDYPADGYRVHVIADNCSDRTAEIGRGYGAAVHERKHLEKRGKGYALNWAANRLADDIAQADGVVIIDADTVISSNFLQVMSDRLSNGERVIQAYYAAAAPEQSTVSSLRYAALAVLHYLRPQGRMVLGGSAGLKGNGMVFSPEIITRFPWPASLTEDIEYHMTLLLAGERVTFAPDAVVWGEMPVSLTQSRSQHDRWEQGRLSMARRYVPQLFASARRALRDSNRRQAFIYLDAVMEHLIPPFSILTAGSVTALILSAIAFASVQASNAASMIQNLAAVNLLLGFSLLAGKIIYLVSGLRLVGASPTIYRSLFFAPFFIVWKIWQYTRVWLHRSKTEWIRTARNEG